MPNVRKYEELSTIYPVLIWRQFPIEINATAAFHPLASGSNQSWRFVIIIDTIDQVKFFDEPLRDPVALFAFGV